MDDRRRTLVAVALIVGVLVAVAILVGSIATRTVVVSPLPAESAIKIIFNTPTIAPGQSTTPTPSSKAATPSPSVKTTPITIE